MKNIPLFRSSQIIPTLNTNSANLKITIKEVLNIITSINFLKIKKYT